MRDRIDLFIASVLVLFLELACIRWFPAHVLFLTFFTNVMLLAAFLGISVGCLAASRRRSYLAWTPALLLCGARRLVPDRVGTAADRERRASGQRGVPAARVLRRRVAAMGSFEVRRPDRGGVRRALRPRCAGARRAGPATWTGARSHTGRIERLHRQHRRKHRRHSALHGMLMVAAGTDLVVRRRPRGDRLFPEAHRPCVDWRSSR